MNIQNLLITICQQGKLIFIGVICMSSSNSFSQDLNGAWSNQEEKFSLILADSSGQIISGTQALNLHRIILSSVDQYYNINFNIDLDNHSLSCYAIIKTIDKHRIQYLSFLSKDLRDVATEQLISTGIILTKQL